MRTVSTERDQSPSFRRPVPLSKFSILIHRLYPPLCCLTVGVEWAYVVDTSVSDTLENRCMVKAYPRNA